MRAGNSVTAASSRGTYDVAEVRMQVSLEKVRFRLKCKNKPGKITSGETRDVVEVCAGRVRVLQWLWHLARPVSADQSLS